MARVQVVIDPGERERFRSLADAEGLSLSAWFKKAARQYAQRHVEKDRLASGDELRAFLSRLRPEHGHEPDWEEIRQELIRAKVPDDVR